MWSRDRWLTSIVVLIGIWHNLALLVLWWLASRRQWRVYVDFNSQGEALMEGILAHTILLVLLVAFALLLTSAKRQPKSTQKADVGPSQEAQAQVGVSAYSASEPS